MIFFLQILGWILVFRQNWYIDWKHYGFQEILNWRTFVSRWKWSVDRYLFVEIINLKRFLLIVSQAHKNLEMHIYILCISGSNKIDRSVRKFLEILALCHTVQVAPKRVTKSTKNLKVSLRDPGELAYNASRSVGLWSFKFGDICCPVLTSSNPKKIRLDKMFWKFINSVHMNSSFAPVPSKIWVGNWRTLWPCQNWPLIFCCQSKKSNFTYSQPNLKL